MLLENIINVSISREPKFDGSGPEKEFMEMSSISRSAGNGGIGPLSSFELSHSIPHGIASIFSGNLPFILLWKCPYPVRKPILYTRT